MAMLEEGGEVGYNVMLDSRVNVEMLAWVGNTIPLQAAISLSVFGP